jgi:asparagine synthase (glutamine-hydrolysing)
LTGEGADEAFAGYVWFKSQKAFDALGRHGAAGIPWAIRAGLLAMLGGGTRRLPPFAAQGVRTAQQDVHDPLGQARHFFFRRELWERIGDCSPYEDVDLGHPRLRRWHPLHQSLYMEYKLMLPGHLLLGKGDRVSMGASVEARYPFLDEDLIAFAATLSPHLKLRGFREKWLLRQLAARTLPARIADRPKSMFRASRAPIFFGDDRPAWVDELLSPASLRATGLFDGASVVDEIEHQRRLPFVTPRRVTFDATLIAVLATQLFHHLYCGGGLCSLPRWSAPS